MYCPHCGENLPPDAKFCRSCGGVQESSTPVAEPPQGSGRVGFSPKINDPAFAKYLKNSNKYSAIFAGGLAIAAVIGFYIAGENSSEMDNPESLYIGFGIGGMFLLIALFQIMGRNRSTTWDGTVVDKKITKKKRKRHTGSADHNDYYIQVYTEYVVYIKGDDGKRKELTAEDDDTVYNYYRIGDRVRHHAGLNSYEKYDKSNDTIVFCNACASLNDIRDDYCFRCKCPLLK